MRRRRKDGETQKKLSKKKSVKKVISEPTQFCISEPQIV